MIYTLFSLCRLTLMDQLANDSRTRSPAELSVERAYWLLSILEPTLLSTGPPLFTVTRPPFFRPPFLPVLPPLNPLLMHFRCPMTMPDPNAVHECTLPSPTVGEYFRSMTFFCSSQCLADSQVKLTAKKLKKSFQKKTNISTGSVLQETVWCPCWRRCSSSTTNFLSSLCLCQLVFVRKDWFNFFWSFLWREVSLSSSTRKTRETMFEGDNLSADPRFYSRMTGDLCSLTLHLDGKKSNKVNSPYHR